MFASAPCCCTLQRESVFYFLLFIGSVTNPAGHAGPPTPRFPRTWLWRLQVPALSYPGMRSLLPLPAGCSCRQAFLRLRLGTSCQKNQQNDDRQPHHFFPHDNSSSDNHMCTILLLAGPLSETIPCRAGVISAGLRSLPHICPAQGPMCGSSCRSCACLPICGP